MLCWTWKPHPYFERRDADLYAPFRSPLCRQRLGRNFSARAEWRETVKIPEGTQTGEIIRLRERDARSAWWREGRPLREHSVESL